MRAQNNKDIKAVVSDVNAIKQYKHTKGLLNFIEKSVTNINEMAKKGESYAMDICTVLEYISKVLQNALYIYIIFCLPAEPFQ